MNKAKLHESIINNSQMSFARSGGNGSAMRVASVGWLFETLERTREVARWSAEVTHNHPEEVKGAESVASVIWMARNGYYKTQIARKEREA